ncbi:hypothetical protein [Flavobacterium sp. UBA4197]|uniref:hypothetical protein n=1 Tax=Flavobacterium sp. UBA4197 TaxID=1946546 RepID=UPI00258112FE|nr:hypothetical protein [Flavobacterium sp. UBA4197]HRB72438.1 hypothetical protein [Flavobacterium sp.]
MTENQKKHLKIGGGVVIGGIVIYYLFFSASSAGSGGSAEDPTGNGGVTNPGNLYVFDAKKVADELYDAMKISGYASFINPNERERIFKALERVNPTQFGQVVQKFALRSYNKTFGNQINYLPFTSLPLEPLKVWLKTELTEDDYNLLKLKYPNHL